MHVAPHNSSMHLHATTLTETSLVTNWNHVQFCVCNLWMITKPLNKMFSRHMEIHSHNTRQRYDPNIIVHKSVTMANSFICLGPKLWNKLPQKIKESRSLNVLKVHSKCHYISSY